MGIVLLPAIIWTFWAVEQADAQGFVQPAQAQLELNVYDAYAVDDYCVILLSKRIQR